MTYEQLDTFLNAGVIALLLTFVRIGTAFMIMPSIGDAFVQPQHRLYLAMSFSLLIMPMTDQYIPNQLPSLDNLLIIILVEFLIGFFIGGIARVLFSALDVAGAIYSTMGGIRNSDLFNPILATQGSLVGAFLMITAMALFFATGLHHMMLRGLISSYEVFPFGTAPDIESLTETFARMVAACFNLGFTLAAPIVVVGLMMHLIKALFARLIPGIQIMIVFMPAQITIGLFTLMFVSSSIFLYFLDRFEAGMSFLFLP